MDCYSGLEWAKEFSSFAALAARNDSAFTGRDQRRQELTGLIAMVLQIAVGPVNWFARDSGPAIQRFYFV
jgi:hypothetical protein